MMDCRMIDAYLEHRLPPESIDRFETHLDTCTSCRQRIHDWRHIRAGVNALLSDKIRPADRSDAARLIERIHHPEAAGANRMRTIPAGLKWGLAAAFAGLLLVLVNVISHTPDKAREQGEGRDNIAVSVLYPNHYHPKYEDHAFVLTASAARRLLAKVGPARIGLTKQSDARVLRSDDAEVRLGLLDGTMGVAFSPERPRQSLSIRAGRYTIRVVGTRFWVTRATNRIEVGVVSGVVAVDGPDRSTPLTVAKGHRLVLREDGGYEMQAVSPGQQRRLSHILDPDGPEEDHRDTEAMPLESTVKTLNGSASRAVAPDASEASTEGAGDLFAEWPKRRRRGAEETLSLESVKGWILNGEYAKAARALTDRVAKKTSDTEAMMLLAHCYSRSGAPKKAVQVLRSVIRKGSPQARNQARFKAGMLYQDKLGRHAEAVEMFDAYLKTKKSLRPNTLEAKIRLARSLGQSGNRARLRSVLQNIVDAHGGTDAAARAKQQLEAFDETPK